MSDNKQKVSVVIRAKNEDRWIGHCIQSVLDHLDTPEILVIDNNSSDRTIEIARHFQQDPETSNDGNYTDLKILNINDYSPGRSLNMGVKEAKYENLLIISSHCVLKKFILEKHLKDLEKYSTIFGNQIPIYEGKKITKRYLWKHFGDEEIVDMYSEMEGRYFFHNALSFFKTKTLLENPFDENLVGKEDRYWVAKMISNSYKSLYDPQMEVDHHYTSKGNTWKGIG